ncbi:MAG: Flp family type IVb pilin [Bacillota bacterium]
MRNLLARLLREESGQGMAEYGLILALVAIAVIAILGTMGTNLNTIFTRISDRLGQAAGQQ